MVYGCLVHAFKLAFKNLSMQMLNPLSGISQKRGIRINNNYDFLKCFLKISICTNSPTKHNSHCIIQNTFSKHQGIQVHIYVQVIKNCQDCKRIRRWNQGTKVQGVQESKAALEFWHQIDESIHQGSEDKNKSFMLMWQTQKSKLQTGHCSAIMCFKNVLQSLLH